MQRSEYRKKQGELAEQWDAGIASDVSSECEGDPAPEYEKKVGTNLWGASSYETPLRAEVLLEHASAAAPNTSEWTGGLSERLEPVRDKFLGACYFDKRNGIPEKKHFNVHIPCPHLHYGACRKRHPGVDASGHRWSSLGVERATISDNIRASRCER